ncbi:YceH family protein [Salsipaludibacter albus]|uniref:YceH family protein n=1 Tax=Salsipaludibacter albus TaxID=2849650 RepID=UPI001EE494A6|nr:YceH family protein [Salsipaludibacter albus]MBY5162753.1 YceH family protein [Salsipaludibacter albus]
MDDGTVTGDLSPIEVRVLGCLVEKEATTPASYPLTLNALRNACNQTSSRDPVMDVTEQEVQSALLSLRDRRLARPVRNPGDRVTKFRHAVPDELELDDAQTAVLSVLALRGAQTPGELRTRTGRQHDFATVEEVGDVLAGLSTRSPALARELARGPGQKESRWLHLLGDHPGEDGDEATPAAASASAPTGGSTMAATWVAGAEAVVAAIADPAVGAAWDQLSVLEGQTVASLAGHLARGAVWLVGEYLDDELDDELDDDLDQSGGPPDFTSAAHYVADLADSLTDDDHRAIRDRGAAVAAVGHDHLVRTARARLDALATRVPTVEPDRVIAAYAGLSIRFDDYLATRIVEQAVHLDDLDRSVAGLDVDVPDEVVAVATTVGLDVLRRRHGSMAGLRVLYRATFAADCLPVF